MESPEGLDIPIDESFLEQTDDKITFSVNKVEKKPILELESPQETFLSLMKTLSEQLEFEFECEKTKKKPKVTDKSPPRTNNLLTRGLMETRTTFSMRSRSTEELNKSMSFPYGSQKMPEVLAIYKPKPTPMLKKAAYQPSKETILKKKFRGIGNLEDSSLRHDQSDAKNIIKTMVPSAISAIHYAFLNHQNLALSPSDFIILIGQGLATHINMNAEKLKHHFVEHNRPLVIKNINAKISPNGKSNWTSIFEVLSEGIKKAIKPDVYNAIIDDFSTGNPISKITSEMNLMDSMKNYFKYKPNEGCGFPKITLKGTSKDWKKFQDKIHILRDMNFMDQLELDWWFRTLLPVVDKISEAGIERKIDRKFWGNMCQNLQDYGMTITGWINVFLPYLYNKSDGHKRNNVLKTILLDDFTFNMGADPQNISEGISKVPFFFVDGAGSHAMHCYSGVLGAKYDEKNDWVEPSYFWSIYEDARI